MINPARPSFVITGFDYGDEAVVIGSTDLIDGEFESETETIRSTFAPFHASGRTTHTFSTRMREYRMARGPDMASALRTLFDVWSPTDATNPASIAGQRELNPWPTTNFEPFDALLELGDLVASNEKGLP